MTCRPCWDTHILTYQQTDRQTHRHTYINQYKHLVIPIHGCICVTYPPFGGGGGGEPGGAGSYIYIYPKFVSDSCSEYFSRFWWRYWDFSEPLVESPTSNKCRSAIPEVLNSQSLFSELVGHTIWQPTLAPTSSSSTSLWPSLVRRFLGLHLCLEEEGSNWSRRLDFWG